MEYNESKDLKDNIKVLIGKTIADASATETDIYLYFSDGTGAQIGTPQNDEWLSMGYGELEENHENNEIRR
jgi:hypothetical protein